jgi:hypothetical protein
VTDRVRVRGRRRRWVGVCLIALVAGAVSAGDGFTAPAAVPTIRLRFDYSAAERMVEAIGRPSLSEAEANGLLENRGIAAMVKKTGVFSPSSTPEAFVADMRSFVATHRYPTGDFALDWIYKHRDAVRALVRELRAGENTMRTRMIERLSRHAPRTGAVTITVYFVAGGMSDGFVLDDDPELAMFVALEKASGDRDGVEQNVTHELYHVLQKASAAETPGAVAFAATLKQQPPLQQLLATTLWEGTANFAADAREAHYVRNLAPDRIREHFRVFDSVVGDLDKGAIDWDAAYRAGFTGEDARFYFVGLEMARALAAARGPGYFEELFDRPPTRFFRDYVALTKADRALPRFSARTRGVIEALPASW